MFVSVNGARLFFDVAGSKLEPRGPAMHEKPTLLVLHGGPGFDHSGFRPDFDEFSDVAQVVYLDHRGNGRSVPSDSRDWTLAQWGDDIKGFCDALGIEKPVVLGQSFGGMVAQSYAARHPSHARGIVFSSTAARMNLKRVLDAFQTMGGQEAHDIAERFWTRGHQEDIVDYMRVCQPLYNPKPRPGGADAGKRTQFRFEVYRHFSLPDGEMWRMDLRHGLEKLECPSYVIGGDSDPVTDVQAAREIAAALPQDQLSFEIFENCGHGAFRDEKDLVFGKLRDFIRRVSPSN